MNGKRTLFWCVSTVPSASMALGSLTPITLFQFAVLAPPAKLLATVGAVPLMVTAPPSKKLD
jgi:hypothetical protein